MRVLIRYALLLGLLITVAACAPTQVTKPTAAMPKINKIFVWDADGHTDLTFLRGLKAEAQVYLKSKGFSVPENEGAADAYLKITVYDAMDDDGHGHSYVNARAYLVLASDESVVYDRTYEARVKLTDGAAPAFPVNEYIREALKDLKSEK